MKTTSLLLSALFATTLLAQDDKKPGTPMPEPKHKEHDALKALAGTWDCVMRAEAMPGVPGMETATESKGTENVELLANGLWLKSTVNGTYKGKPFQGIWLAGYDPFRKEYTSVWVSSCEEDPNLCTMTGGYDEATKTWIWNGKTPHGDMRSVAVVQAPDSIVETSYLKGADGKETKCMEVTRKRSRAPVAVDASWSTKIPAEVEPLHQDIGAWDATVRCTAPGETTASEWQGTERIAAIAGGRWLWSDFLGTFQGAPYEGHGLIGYDPEQKKIVSIWVDSMSPVWCRTEGDAAAKGELTLTGTCTDANGRPMKVKQVVSRTADATRTMKMESECVDGTAKMDISYRRKGKS